MKLPKKEVEVFGQNWPKRQKGRLGTYKKKTEGETLGERKASGQGRFRGKR